MSTMQHNDFQHATRIAIAKADQDITVFTRATVVPYGSEYLRIKVSSVLQRKVKTQLLANALVAQPMKMINVINNG
jgi:hypothetical protein